MPNVGLQPTFRDPTLYYKMCTRRLRFSLQYSVNTSSCGTMRSQSLTFLFVSLLVFRPPSGRCPPSAAPSGDFPRLGPAGAGPRGRRASPGGLSHRRRQWTLAAGPDPDHGLGGPNRLVVKGILHVSFATRGGGEQADCQARLYFNMFFEFGPGSDDDNCLGFCGCGGVSHMRTGPWLGQSDRSTVHTYIVTFVDIALAFGPALQQRNISILP